jgi:hypothetical protein
MEAVKAPNWVVEPTGKLDVSKGSVYAITFFFYKISRLMRL